mgnify:CR=1 FL=1
MSSAQIFKLVYAGVALLAAFVLARRLADGEWGWALLPLAVIVFSIYRFATIEDE